MDKRTCKNCGGGFSGLRAYLKHLRTCMDGQVKAVGDNILYLPRGQDNRYGPQTNTEGWLFLEWK